MSQATMTGTITTVIGSKGYGWFRLRGQRRAEVFFNAADLDGLEFDEQLTQLDVRFEPDHRDPRCMRARNIWQEFE